jgi:hypothetical protein
MPGKQPPFQALTEDDAMHDRSDASMQIGTAEAPSAAPGRIRIDLERSSELPLELCPLTPPREARLELDGFGLGQLGHLRLDAEVELNPGELRLPIFPSEDLCAVIAPGGRYRVSLEARTPPDAGPEVEHVRVVFDPPVLVEELLPMLTRLPALFEDESLAALAAWLRRQSLTAPAGLRPAAVAEWAAQWGAPLQRALGSRAPIAAWREGLELALQGLTGRLAAVRLEEVQALPVKHAGRNVLQLRFSGRVDLAAGASVPFTQLALPYQLVPALEASLPRLMSAQPLATATLRIAELRAGDLAAALLTLARRASGSFEASGELPDLHLGLRLPDQGKLQLEAALSRQAHVCGSFTASMDEHAASVDAAELHLRLGEQDLRLAADARLGCRPQNGLALSARIGQAVRTGNWAQSGLEAAAELRLLERAALGPLPVTARVRHAEILGGLDLHASVDELLLDGRMRLELHTGATPLWQPQLDTAFEARLRLTEDSRFGDGCLEALPAGSHLHLRGRVTSGTHTEPTLELDGDAKLRCQVRRPVSAFPELDIEAGDLAVDLETTARFQARAVVRQQCGALAEVDFGGSSIEATVQTLLVSLGRRSLLLPDGSTLGLRLTEAVLGASGLGRACAELEWDLKGRSPELQDGLQVVEIFVPELRHRAFRVELGPGGGLLATGDRGDLYDARFFNALLNPGAEPDRLLEILADERAMDRVLAAVRLFSEEAHELLEALLHAARRVRRAVDEEAVRRPGDAIPAPKLARLISRALAGSTDLAERVLGLVQGVVAGEGPDVLAAKALLIEVFGDHGYDYELDRALRWLARLLAPTEPLPPREIEELPPLELEPSLRGAFDALPSARSLYTTLAAPRALPEGFSETVARIAPYLTLEQVEYLLETGRDGWESEDRVWLGHVLELKRRTRLISESYGGVAFAPQAAAIAFFLGETLAMGREQASRRAPRPELGIADSLLGPADAAALLQAGLASVLQTRTVQLNQQMLLQHVLAQPRDYLLGVLSEISADRPRVLAGVLNALLNLPQDCLCRPLDVVGELSARLGLELPRLDDYLAGGRWARLSYYQELSQAAEQILRQAQPYVARRCHLQIDRQPLAEPRQRSGMTRRRVDWAQQAIARADAQAARCRFPGSRAATLRSARRLYERAFERCATVLEADPEAFHEPWLRDFWSRNHEALVVLSVVRNVQEDVDRVRHWLEVRSGAPVPADEQQLVDAVIDALYYRPEDRAALKADPLLRLLIDPPVGRYDFTVISCMGVITEGVSGRELEAAFQRLEERRGVRVIRAGTATWRSLQYNAVRVEEAIREATTPYGILGYSQGCANGLMAESRLLGGTPGQQALAGRLRCRNLLFSAFNGSAHGTCGDWKLSRAMVEGERFLKHYQAVLSKPAIEMGLRALRLALDSQTLVLGLLGSDSLSHEGVRSLHREGQFRPDVPTSAVRGVVEPETLPEALEWLSNVLTRELESAEHDTQVAVDEAMGYPLFVRNEAAEVLRRCYPGDLVQRTHHWSPLLYETEAITTERDRARAIYDFPKDRHVFPWIEVNARFGRIARVPAPSEADASKRADEPADRLAEPPPRQDLLASSTA